MPDQSFTVDNFRKVFDYDNRKGCYLEGRYFPEIEIITKNLKNCATEFKKLNKEKSALPLEKYEDKKAELNYQKDQLKEQKEKLLKQELEKIIEQISKCDFCIKLVQVDTVIGKPAYSIEKFDVYTYFIIKQIQYNIKKLYKVQQSNRHSIICQLQSLLNDSFPKYIIRTDIKEFYESIPRKRLIDKINKDGLLKLSSKKFIKVILNEYGKISGSSIGIPRGIGISAYLAELYMREFDEAIKTHPEIIFYARYVDDIIVIYAPKPNSNSDLSDLLDKISQEAGKLELTLNEVASKKTETIDLVTNKNGTFEYLGYSFSAKAGGVDIKISKNKEKRYKNRITAIFNEYKKEKIYEKKARKLFVKRLQFLTGNTRLSNNKDNALVGIYFSNRFLTSPSCLQGLDTFLKIQIDSLDSPTLKNVLKKCLFKKDGLKKSFINLLQKIYKK